LEQNNPTNARSPPFSCKLTKAARLLFQRETPSTLIVVGMRQLESSRQATAFLNYFFGFTSISNQLLRSNNLHGNERVGEI